MKAMKSKEKTSSSASFAKGGSGKMSGPNQAGPQKPGQSTSMGQKASASPGSGGGKAMKGFSGAAPAAPGKVSVGGSGGDTSFSVKGGSGKMAGYTGSTPAKPC